MPCFTEDQIRRARSIDLLTYLQTNDPTELVRINGNTWCTREHDSLKISSNGKWMWWSRGFGGASALDYLIKVKGMTFTQAMQILADDTVIIPESPAKSEINKGKGIRRKLLLPERSETNLEIIRYLTGRGIDKDIIQYCIDEGLLYESLPYHNCVFVGYDEAGKAAYAYYRVTNGDRSMGDAAGSNKAYAFRIEGHDGTTVHVFEGAIDLLSYATLLKIKTGEWRAEPMISLGGVYAPSHNRSGMRTSAALLNALENHHEIDTVALHLDNDFAGRAAAKAIVDNLQDRYIIRNEPPL